MLKFRHKVDPDDGLLFVSWCEHPGMIGVSAPTYEELKNKLRQEVEAERKKYPHKYPVGWTAGRLIFD